jgi:pectinesterase
MFQNCNIYPRRPADPRSHDVITAQGREEHGGSSGFVFQNCSITSSPAPQEGLAGIQTFLGRPWKHHARVVFMACSIDSIIHADGWVSWNRSEGAKPTPPSGQDSHIYYGEYKNHGGGASVAHRVDWDGFHIIQSDEEAKQFTARKFIHGGDWLPETGVDYYLGLN